VTAVQLHGRLGSSISFEGKFVEAQCQGARTKVKQGNIDKL
jgi:hypothetical protein